MRLPHIVTDLPGPRAQAAIAADGHVASRSLIKAYPLVVNRGEGMVIEDVDGNRFLDFMSGIAVTLTGHCHPEVVARIRGQTERLLHICGTDFYYDTYTALCTRLSALCPGEDAWRVYLGNSGAEAVEAAIKLARYHTGRAHLIAFEGAFHGRTYGAMSLTASKAVQRAGFGPHLPGVHHVPYGAGIEHHLRGLFKRTVTPEEVAAIIVEPIQGEGGHRVPPPGFFAHLRTVCDEFGILLIADEIQTGMGRTGTFFAMEQWDIVPDIITLGKGLGSGLPISAMMAKDKVMTWPRGSHGSTFGGNPLACAAGLATLDLVEDNLMENAREMGAYVGAQLQMLAARHDAISEVRGRGLMLALAFAEHGQAGTFERNCFERGLLVLGCGNNAVRLAPPMIVTHEAADTAATIMDTVLTRGLG